jgi:hypothetical protein
MPGSLDLLEEGRDVLEIDPRPRLEIFRTHLEGGQLTGGPSRIESLTVSLKLRPERAASRFRLSAKASSRVRVVRMISLQHQDASGRSSGLSIGVPRWHVADGG